MAILLRSLFLLPLLFLSGSSQIVDDLLFGNGNKVPQGNKPDFQTNFLGDWKIDNPNVGVASMHFQLMPNNKVIMFDATSTGPSTLQLPAGNCRPFIESPRPGELDCWAHAIEYDIQTSEVRPLKVLTDSWCSSGGLAADGTLVNTGGWEAGVRAVRTMKPCDDCDWQENAIGLASPRWYATQEKLEDGSFILFGGRHEFSYEIVQNGLRFPYKRVMLPFLAETTDKYENNLYPFAYLLPDGNVFLLANFRSIILDPKTGRIIHELPELPGGSRNYPASGQSALLPLKIVNGQVQDVEVIVCGGNKANGFKLAEQKNFSPALQDCGRIKVMQPNAKWEIEMMPSRRVMGDMLILPNGQLLILNGAVDGTSGWGYAKTPNRTPVLYSPDNKPGERFKELNPTAIPRMYHATSGVMPDGTVLVAGSNTNPRYILDNKGAEFPTELRVERFYPPYLDPLLEVHRALIFETQLKIKYGTKFTIDAKFFDILVDGSDLKVTLLAPPFTTHGYSQNQRMLVLDVEKFFLGALEVVAPPNGKVAPPGYYLLFVVNRGVPSRGIWVHIN